MVNWTDVLSNRTRLNNVRRFAEGELTGQQLVEKMNNTEVISEVRYLLRRHGVTYARRLARKALRRRGVTVNYEN